MTRRTFLAASAGAAVSAAAPARSKFGIATTCYMTVRRPKDMLEFLEYCNTLGAAGIQSGITSHDPEYLKRVRSRAEQLGMYIEVMAPLPKANMQDFVQTMNDAKELGALCVRSACLGGRRYETFADLNQWNQFVSDSTTAIKRAVPVAEKLKLPFGIENHKDWTVNEMVPLLKGYSSEYFGCCLDTGNNIALLDNPMEVVTRLAPYAISTHIKNMAVAESPDGFYLSEMPLDQGMLDVNRIMSIIAEARPKTKMTLEMITRNPLLVPCLSDKYWTTFPAAGGLALARTLRMVREKKSKLPTLDGLDHAAQLKLEEDNVKHCLSFA